MEEAVQFTCNGKRLYGILHAPEAPASTPDVVMIITGGPQTRYGSHRLSVLLARRLCRLGVAAFRFDYGGLGDSEDPRVEAEEAGPCIHAAVQFLDAVLPGCRKVVWSLCDGATAGARYASRHPGVLSGLILCNPFLHDQALLYKKHYYKEKLLDKAFWKRLLRLDINLSKSLLVGARFLGASAMRLAGARPGGGADGFEPFTPDSFLGDIRDSRVPVCCILSEHDYIAREFQSLLMTRKGKKAFGGNGAIRVLTVGGADHTFSHPECSESLFSLTVRALREMGVAGARTDGTGSQGLA